MKDRAALPDGIEERDPQWHFDHYCDFIAMKMAVGEPSPHLRALGEYCRGMAQEEAAWLLGCQASIYVQTPGNAIFDAWTAEEVRRNSAGLYAWLVEHWKGIVTRVARRCVRTPEHLAECLVSYANWLQLDYPRLRDIADLYNPQQYYDMVWESVDKHVKYFGRYIMIRAIEGLNRYCGIPAALYDIRTMDGWSPRMSMCYMYPNYASVLLDDSRASNAQADRIVDHLLTAVQKRLPAVTPYILAGTLCEYRKCFQNRDDSAGKTLQQEYELHLKVQDHWPQRLSDRFYTVRLACFPPEVLGELHGWTGPRKECDKVLRDVGINWSDLRYDYNETRRRNSWDNPVERIAA